MMNIEESRQSLPPVGKTFEVFVRQRRFAELISRGELGVDHLHGRIVARGDSGEEILGSASRTRAKLPLPVGARRAQLGFLRTWRGLGTHRESIGTRRSTAATIAIASRSARPIMHESPPNFNAPTDLAL